MIDLRGHGDCRYGATAVPDAVNLFSCLDQDPAQGQSKYEDIRKRLKMFFECSYLPDVDGLVQEVFLRAIQALAAGKRIYSAEPHSFFLAIARNIRYEEWKRRKAEQGVPEDVAVPASGDGHAGRIEDAIYIRELLDRACDADRRILIENHDEGGRLAENGSLIGKGAWRVLVHRARKRMRKLAAGRGTKVTTR